MSTPRKAIIDATAITANFAVLVRAGQNDGTVDDYARLDKDNVEMPPLDVFKKEDAPGEFILADGESRRVAQVEVNGKKKVNVLVHDGTAADAILFAVAANSNHGRPRTAGDKRKTILLLLEQPNMNRKSDREIDRMYGNLSHHTVAEVRAAMGGQSPKKRKKNPFDQLNSKFEKVTESFALLAVDYLEEHDSEEFKAVNEAAEAFTEAVAAFRKKVGKKKAA